MLNVIPIVTTKNSYKYIQKEMRKEFKYFTTKKGTKHKRQECRK